MMLQTSYRKKKHDSNYTDYKTDELMDHGISHMAKQIHQTDHIISHIKINFAKQQVALIPLLESSDKKTQRKKKMLN